jgi:methylase of polypeptide subunit release factors
MREPADEQVRQRVHGRRPAWYTPANAAGQAREELMGVGSLAGSVASAGTSEALRACLDADGSTDGLGRLWCGLLHWHPPARPGRPLVLRSPGLPELTVVPVARLGTVPVLSLVWPDGGLPDPGRHRAVYRALAPACPEHVLCYATADGKRRSFVWARSRPGEEAELTVLSHESGSPVRVAVGRLGMLDFGEGQPPADLLAQRLSCAFDVDTLSRAFAAEYRAAVGTVAETIQGVPEAIRRRHAERQLERLLLAHFLGRGGRLSRDGAAVPEEDSGNGHFLSADLAAARALFARYPFTLVEPTPGDSEVAVDPAVLGAIYEESVPGRHERGSYFTPRGVVSFMCREALKAYLAEAVPGQEAARFVDGADAAALSDPAAAAGALGRVRVCDPACGCGAFLLGMLHELLRLRQALIERAGDVHSVSNLSQRKRRIIEHNLHGVESDPAAVAVTRLRLGLSLASDGERELPRCEATVRLGDSLAGWPAGTGRFDIVVTNPPYVRMELFKGRKPALRRDFPEVHAERADLYVYFYARAQELLRPGGVGCFVSSNRWLRAGYGEGLRRRLLDDRAVRLVVDFGELPLFAAGTFPAIVLWQNRPRGRSPTRWAAVRDLRACHADGLRAHVDRLAQTVPAGHFGPGRPRLRNPATAALRQKMEAAGPRLAEVGGGRLCRGVVTGLNDAFVVDGATRDRLLAADPGSAAVLRPLLAGDDVRRYEVHFRGRHLLAVANGTDLREYPAVARHLEPFRPRLERRANRQPWFALQQPQAAYAPLFAAAKIVYPVIGKEARFVRDGAGYYVNDKVFFVPGGDWYLLAVLNSAAAFDYLKGTCSVLGDEDQGGRLEFRELHVRMLPVPDAPSAERRALAALAERAQGLHARRRQRVETFLGALGTDPAASGSRNRLEQPWRLTPADIRRGGHALPPFLEARDETAALTEAIAAAEREIDVRVAGLYGVDPPPTCDRECADRA